MILQGIFNCAGITSEAMFSLLFLLTGFDSGMMSGTKSVKFSGLVPRHKGYLAEIKRKAEWRGSQKASI